MTEFKVPVPEIGRNYHFFDDGKTSPSRHYVATVVDIIPFSRIGSMPYEELLCEAERKKYLEDITKDGVEKGPTLLDIWNGEVKNCDWLYAKETDFIVKCVIPSYDDNPIFFARTLNDGWFSMDTTSGWQSGRLDIDGSIFDKAYKDDDYFYKHWLQYRVINHDELQKIYAVSPEIIDNLARTAEDIKKERK